MDWTTLAPLVLTSSVLAAFLTHGLSWLKDLWSQRRDADFAALYVALSLEEYASGCASLVTDIDMHSDSAGAAGVESENVPPLPGFPKQIDWKPLGIKLTTEVLSFKVRVSSTRVTLDGLWVYIGDGVVREAQEQAVALGLDAIRIAEHLRQTRKLGPPRAEPNGWSAKEALNKKLAEVEARRADEAANPDLSFMEGIGGSSGEAA